MAVHWILIVGVALAVPCAQSSSESLGQKFLHMFGKRREDHKPTGYPMYGQGLPAHGGMQAGMYNPGGGQAYGAYGNGAIPVGTYNPGGGQAYGAYGNEMQSGRYNTGGGQAYAALPVVVPTSGVAHASQPVLYTAQPGYNVAQPVYPILQVPSKTKRKKHRKSKGNYRSSSSSNSSS